MAWDDAGAKQWPDEAIPYAAPGTEADREGVDAAGRKPWRKAVYFLVKAVNEIRGARGRNGGVASLDRQGHIPTAQMRAGEAGGVATLDATGKLSSGQIPASVAVPTSARYVLRSAVGAAGGVAPLGLSGRVAANFLPPAPPIAPVAWAKVSATGGLSAGRGFSSAARTSVGRYRLTFSTPRADSDYLVLVSAEHQNTAEIIRYDVLSTSSFTVSLDRPSRGSNDLPDDGAFVAIVFD